MLSAMWTGKKPENVAFSMSSSLLYHQVHLSATRRSLENLTHNFTLRFATVYRLCPFISVHGLKLL